MVGKIVPFTAYLGALQRSFSVHDRPAATKLIWLALRMAEKWKNPPISWHAAKAQLAIQFEDRFVLSE